MKKRKNRAKRKDPLAVKWWLRQQVQKELRWENNPKFWSKLTICYIVGITCLAVGLISVLFGDLSQISWAIGYLLNILLGLGLTIAAGLCHYSKNRNPKPLTKLFKELSIYARQHDRNVWSVRNAIRTKKDDFTERRSWELLEQKLSGQKFRWEEITHAVLGLRRAERLNEPQLAKIQKFTEEVRALGLNLVPEQELLSFGTTIPPQPSHSTSSAA